MKLVAPDVCIADDVICGAGALGTRLFYYYHSVPEACPVSFGFGFGVYYCVRDVDVIPVAAGAGEVIKISVSEDCGGYLYTGKLVGFFRR